MDTSTILTKIESAVINKAHIHPSDEKRVTRIFFDVIQQEKWYGMDEVQIVVNSLSPQFSEFTKERILDIANVILNLGDRS